jgi:ferredoxin
VGVGAVGLGAGVLTIHRLMNPGESSYPPEDPRRVQPDGAPDVLSAAAATQPERPRLLRPPGALPEPAFLAACIRCTRCQDACDEGAIRFFDERYGSAVHTPYVDPSVRACTLCMKCTEACPSRALEPVEDRDYAAVSMGSVALSEDLCLSHKARRIREEQDLLFQLGRSATESEAPYERRGPCGECHMFCPVKDRAITLLPGAFLAPEIHVDDCVGCGLCEWICRRVTHGVPAIRVVQTRAWAQG